MKLKLKFNSCFILIIQLNKKIRKFYANSVASKTPLINPKHRFYNLKCEREALWKWKWIAYGILSLLIYITNIKGKKKTKKSVAEKLERRRRLRLCGRGCTLSRERKTPTKPVSKLSFSEGKNYFISNSDVNSSKLSEW